VVIVDKESEEFSNPDLKNAVEPTSQLKAWLVEYVGRKYQGELARARVESGQKIDWNGDITVEMIVDAFSHEFPEFLMAVAEENFIRGYRQGISDTDTGWGMLDARQPE
jgi:hypothetical protein